MGVWSGDSANVLLATEVQLQREVKAAPRGMAEALGYSVLTRAYRDAGGGERACNS